MLVLVGPQGSGRTSLLAAWAADRPDTAWVTDGTVPGDATTVIVDDAEHQPASLWEELDARLQDDPDLCVRIAAHSVATVPDGWTLEALDLPPMTVHETLALLDAVDSPVDRTAAVALTAGHPASIVTVAGAGRVSAQELPAVLAAVGTQRALPPEHHGLVLTDHLTPDLVAHLGASPEVLADAEHAGLGYWADRDRQVFTFVPPVREATRTARTPEPERDRELRLHAAEHFLTRGASLAAFVEAARADRLALVDAALRQGGIPLLRNHGRMIASLLMPVSAVRLGRHPVAAFALAIVLNARREHRLRAVELLGLSVAGARLKPPGSAERALFRVVESVALRVSGLADGGVATAQKAAALLGDLSPRERATLSELEADLLLHTAISLMYGDVYPDADRLLERAAAVTRRSSQHLAVLGARATSAALRGDITTATGRVAQATEHTWPDHELDEYPGSLLRVAQAHLAIERCDFADAAEKIASIWPIIDTIEHWPLLAHLQALVDLHGGPPEAALERFQVLRRQRSGRWSTPESVRSRLNVTESLLLLATGDHTGARRCVSGGRAARLVLQAARVALWTGDDTLAAATLGTVRSKTPGEELVCATLTAVVMRRTGRDHEADEAVSTAAALVETHGMRSPLMLLPSAELAQFGDLATGVPSLLVDRAARFDLPTH